MGKVPTGVLEAQVVKEFGEQWTKFQDNTGYYGSLEVFKDIVGSLLPIERIKGKTVAEIGSGTGRIVKMLDDAGAGTIVAVEPSEAMGPLRKNTENIKDKIEYIQKTGEAWSRPELDYVFSIGVIHHIVNPVPTVKNARENLKSGGKFVIWVYGREGNELYLKLFEPIRKITPKIPHFVLLSVSWVLLMCLNLYVWLCRHITLPMRTYMLNHIGKLNQYSRRITIYDQLNPTWARYYTRAEAESLLRNNGFSDVRSFHRHGYSWTVIGTRD